MFSELREDLVSGDWILVSPGRSSRPSDFRDKSEKVKRTPISKCVFENPSEAGGGNLIASYPKGKKDWKIQVVPNKYPAVRQLLSETEKVIKKQKHGPYSIMKGVGHHELVITRDHDTPPFKASKKEVSNILSVFQDRYKSFMGDENLDYVAIFHNWGEKAGASIYHPHYQIMTLPIIPPDVMHSLKGSKKYFDKKGKCVHCDIIAWEKKEKKRIIVENDEAIAFAPYISRSPFELRIFPKKHISYFEETSKESIDSIADVLRNTLKKMNAAIAPHYNFFIHTAPIHNKSEYTHYHWHIEILPKISKYAGFELGTGVIINSLDPDTAAEIIKSAKAK